MGAHLHYLVTLSPKMLDKRDLEKEFLDALEALVPDQESLFLAFGAEAIVVEYQGEVDD